MSKKKGPSRPKKANGKRSKRNNYKIKAIVTDIDGTLTERERHVDVRVIEALRKVEERGIPVMLASGNVLPVAYGIKKCLGITGPIIAENGGVVCHNEEVKMLAKSMEPEKAFLHLKKELPVKRLFTDIWRISEVGLQTNVPLEDVKRVVRKYAVNVATTGYAHHISSREMNKMVGLREVCKWIGIPPRNVAAFGDSDNDVEMLMGCGVSVAPGNATKKAKRAAKIRANGEYGDGLLEGLHELGLI